MNVILQINKDVMGIPNGEDSDGAQGRKKYNPVRTNSIAPMIVNILRLGPLPTTGIPVLDAEYR